MRKRRNIRNRTKRKRERMSKIKIGTVKEIGNKNGRRKSVIFLFLAQVKRHEMLDCNGKQETDRVVYAVGIVR